MIWKTERLDYFAEDLFSGMEKALPDMWEKGYTQKNAGVLVSKAPIKDRFAVIISGGAGNGPLFPGYVASGLADAASVGGPFAAPNAYAIYEVAKELGKEKGALLLYNNFAGDYLNNDMAQELLELEGIQVESVISNDDIATALGEPRQDRNGRSGIALLIKLAGAYSRAGMALKEAAERLRYANNRLGTISVHVDHEQGKILYGAGFSGEPAFLVEDHMDMEKTAARAAQLLLDDLYTNEYGILGDLFWYQTQNLYQVLRLSDGAILYQDLELVVPLEGMLAVQPMFWMTRCSLLDGDGQVVRELPPNYHLKTIFQTGKKAYLILEDRFGKQTVADSKGTPYLDRFYDEVSVVAGDYAQVRDGSTWMAVDLNSGKTVYRKNGSFQLLPGSILVESGSRGEVKLLDFQGKALYPSPLLDPAPLNEVWMTAARPTNDTYTTVILDYHGKEILALPTEATFLSSLSPNLLFYAAFTGQDTILQKGILRDMDSGREVLLMEGKYLKADTLDVTDGSVILCRGVSLDGVPISRLFTIEGKEILPNVTILDYAGGDVFVTDQGLICLDGTWLYKE